MFIYYVIAIFSTLYYINLTINDILYSMDETYKKEYSIKVAKMKMSLMIIMALFWSAIIIS